MEEFKIERNRATDLVIFAPMLFMSVGGVYLLIEGRSSTFYIALLCVIFCPIACLYFIGVWINNKPVVKLSQEGVFLNSLKRTIKWESISYLKIIEGNEQEDEQGRSRPSRKRHLVLFEITEIKPNGNFGFERKQSLLYTNADSEVATVINSYFKHYKSLFS